MKVTGIDHINLNIKDLDKSLEFYKNLFGFELKEEGISNNERWAIIGISNIALLALYETKESPSYSGFNHFGLVVDDFENFIEKAKSLKIKIELLYDYPKSKSAYILDPNGIEIEVASKFGGDL